MNFLDKVKAYVEKFHMIESGESVVVGVSGGADSVCLLLFLKEYQRYVPFSLYCVHVEHGIRENANEDAEYVQALCERFEVPFFVFHENVPKYAEEHGYSIEEAGRILRYEAFSKVLETEAGGIGKIAVAHHKNDQAETVLFHLFRGSSLRGMGGMSPVRDRIIRPFLSVGRDEIEAFLKEQKIAFQTDETNLTDEYARNRIRNRILPLAEQINTQAIEHIAETATMIAQADAYFSLLSKEYLEEHHCINEEKQEVCLSAEALLKEKDLVIKYILMDCISYVTGKRKDITDAHVTAVKGLLITNGTKEMKLPYGLLVKKVYDTVLFTRNVEEKLVETNFSNRIQKKILPFEKNAVIPQKKYTKWLSYDKIKSECSFSGKPLVERFRRPGDFIVIDEEGHTKKLKEYMIEEKIPKEDRDSIPLLAIGSEILWITGNRISEKYKVCENTKEILEVHIEEEG